MSGDPMRALLQRLEWAGTAPGEFACCPECGGFAPGQPGLFPGDSHGHKQGCVLAAVLAETRAVFWRVVEYPGFVAANPEHCVPTRFCAHRVSAGGAWLGDLSPDPRPTMELARADGEKTGLMEWPEP